MSRWSSEACEATPPGPKFIKKAPRQGVPAMRHPNVRPENQ